MFYCAANGRRMYIYRKIKIIYSYTVNKSRRLSLGTCKTLLMLPSGCAWNESSSRACSFHQETRGAGIPPLAKHVIFMLAPSRYGPMVFCPVCTAPWLSRIISWVGGTEILCLISKRLYFFCVCLFVTSYAWLYK